jgi:hypothetical protein
MIDGPMTTSGDHNSAAWRHDFQEINAGRLITGDRQNNIFPTNDKSPLPHNEETGFYLKSVNSVC